MSDKSKAREGFERLLENYPWAEIAEVWNQKETVQQAEQRQRDFVGRVLYREPGLRMNTGMDGPWLCVDLWENERLLRFAIWRSTGNVYRLDEIGAVEDDPFIVLTTIRHEQ